MSTPHLTSRQISGFLKKYNVNYDEKNNNRNYLFKKYSSFLFNKHHSHESFCEINFGSLSKKRNRSPGPFTRSKCSHMINNLAFVHKHLKFDDISLKNENKNAFSKCKSNTDKKNEYNNYFLNSNVGKRYQIFKDDLNFVKRNILNPICEEEEMYINNHCYKYIIVNKSILSQSEIHQETEKYYCKRNGLQITSNDETSLKTDINQKDLNENRFNIIIFKKDILEQSSKPEIKEDLNISKNNEISKLISGLLFNSTPQSLDRTNDEEIPVTNQIDILNKSPEKELNVKTSEFTIDNIINKIDSKFQENSDKGHINNFKELIPVIKEKVVGNKNGNKSRIHRKSSDNHLQRNSLKFIFINYNEDCKYSNLLPQNKLSKLEDSINIVYKSLFLTEEFDSSHSDTFKIKQNTNLNDKTSQKYLDNCDIISQDVISIFTPEIKKNNEIISKSIDKLNDKDLLNREYYDVMIVEKDKIGQRDNHFKDNENYLFSNGNSSPKIVIYNDSEENKLLDTINVLDLEIKKENEFDDFRSYTKQDYNKDTICQNLEISEKLLDTRDTIIESIKLAQDNNPKTFLDKIDNANSQEDNSTKIKENIEVLETHLYKESEKDYLENVKDNRKEDFDSKEYFCFSEVINILSSTSNKKINNEIEDVMDIQFENNLRSVPNNEENIDAPKCMNDEKHNYLFFKNINEEYLDLDKDNNEVLLQNIEGNSDNFINEGKIKESKDIIINNDIIGKIQKENSLNIGEFLNDNNNPSNNNINPSFIEEINDYKIIQNKCEENKEILGCLTRDKVITNNNGPNSNLELDHNVNYINEEKSEDINETDKVFEDKLNIDKKEKNNFSDQLTNLKECKGHTYTNSKIKKFDSLSNEEKNRNYYIRNSFYKGKRRLKEFNLTFLKLNDNKNTEINSDSNVFNNNSIFKKDWDNILNNSIPDYPKEEGSITKEKNIGYLNINNNKNSIVLNTKITNKKNQDISGLNEENVSCIKDELNENIYNTVLLKNNVDNIDQDNRDLVKNINRIDEKCEAIPNTLDSIRSKYPRIVYIDLRYLRKRYKNEKDYKKKDCESIKLDMKHKMPKKHYGKKNKIPTLEHPKNILKEINTISLLKNRTLIPNLQAFNDQKQSCNVLMHIEKMDKLYLNEDIQVRLSNAKKSQTNKEIPYYLSNCDMNLQRKIGIDRSTINDIEGTIFISQMASLMILPEVENKKIITKDELTATFLLTVISVVITFRSLLK